MKDDRRIRPEIFHTLRDHDVRALHFQVVGILRPIVEQQEKEIRTKWCNTISRIATNTTNCLGISKLRPICFWTRCPAHAQMRKEI